MAVLGAAAASTPAAAKKKGGDTETSYVRFDSLPTFRGNATGRNFSEWIRDNIDLRGGDSLFYTFVIGRDGKAHNINKVYCNDTRLSRRIDSLLAIAEWTPGMIGGSTVATPYEISAHNTITTIEFKENLDDVIYDNNEQPVPVHQQMPRFKNKAPGNESLNEFSSWVLSRIYYPSSFPEGKWLVILSFVVDQNGCVTDIETLVSDHELFEKEARRVIGKSPQWEPGTLNGIPMKTKMNIPILFMR